MDPQVVNFGLEWHQPWVLCPSHIGNDFMQSLRFKKTSGIMKSKHQPIAAMPTNHVPQNLIQRTTNIGAHHPDWTTLVKNQEFWRYHPRYILHPKAWLFLLHAPGVVMKKRFAFTVLWSQIGSQLGSFHAPQTLKSGWEAELYYHFLIYFLLHHTGDPS